MLEKLEKGIKNIMNIGKKVTFYIEMMNITKNECMSHEIIYNVQTSTAVFILLCIFFSYEVYCTTAGDTLLIQE